MDTGKTTLHPLRFSANELPFHRSKGKKGPFFHIDTSLFGIIGVIITARSATKERLGNARSAARNPRLDIFGRQERFDLMPKKKT
jgi:hypothetical protein